MIEAKVITESEFMVLILDVMNRRGHLKSLVAGTLLMLMTSISLTVVAVVLGETCKQHNILCCFKLKEN